MLEKEFWKKKKLNNFSKEEWEALCDRCGKCCVIKLEDVNTSKIHYTNVSCKLLCTKTAKCKKTDSTVNAGKTSKLTEDPDFVFPYGNYGN